MGLHVQIGEDYPGEVFLQATEPGSPADGDTWYDGQAWRRYVTDGWVVSQVQVDDAFDGSVTIGGAEPGSPATGDLWYDGNEWLRYDGADFLSISGGGGGGGDPTVIDVTVADAFHWTSAEAFDNANAHYPYGVPFDASGSTDGYWMVEIPASWTTFSVDLVTFVPLEESGNARLRMEFIDIRNTDNGVIKAEETVAIPANDLFTSGTSIVSTAGVVDAAGNSIDGKTVQIAMTRDGDDAADSLAEVLHVVALILTQES